MKCIPRCLFAFGCMILQSFMSSVHAQGTLLPNYLESGEAALVRKHKIVGAVGVLKVNGTTAPDTSFVIVFNNRGLRECELGFSGFHGILIWKGRYDTRDSLVREEMSWPSMESIMNRDTIIYFYAGGRLVKRAFQAIDDSGGYAPASVENLCYAESGRLSKRVLSDEKRGAFDSTLYEWDKKGNLTRLVYSAIPTFETVKAGEPVRQPEPRLYERRTSGRREGKNSITVHEVRELEGTQAGAVVLKATMVRNARGQIVSLSEAHVESDGSLVVHDSTDIAYDERGFPRRSRHWQNGESEPSKVFEYTYGTSSLKSLADRIVAREAQYMRRPE